ncbi:MAG: hypothetical protein ACRD4Y_08765, partial [Candidatus Acidiferrales bacterium]
MIPAASGGVTGLRAQMFLAAMAGLALRLLFVFRLPSTAGDSDLYLQIGRNWADHHIFGLWLNGHLTPTDMRVPGYPAFLAAVALLLGRSQTAILLSQALVDLLTCFLTAGLASALAPVSARRRVWIAGLWLSATCPFVANYTSVVLSEVVAGFFATGALFCFVLALRATPIEFPFWSRPRSVPPFRLALLGAFLTGIATLIRPEMPLLLAAGGLIYALRWRERLDLLKIVLHGAALTGVFLIPLAPWAIRNFVTLREVQILSPRYATMPDERAPLGYYSWTRTWLERYRDVYT